MKAFMLAGVSSGIGKTTISMALMSAFANVSPFKVGPDYIDPGFHEFITNNKSYNLFRNSILCRLRLDVRSYDCNTDFSSNSQKICQKIKTIGKR